MEARGLADKHMRLRYAGSCRLCDRGLPAGTEAIYEPSSKTVRCGTCVLEPAPTEADHGTDDVAAEPEAEKTAPSIEVDPGVAGASARREFDRRKARREDRIRTAHPKLGGVILALSDEPQSTRAWVQGAKGEERLGTGLDRLTSHGIAILHDRRIPGTRANIDHLAVTTNAVWVIDAKRYLGRPTLRVEGGILRPRIDRLMVGRRDCTKLVDGVLKQMELVTAALAKDDLVIDVKGALAFVDADWPLIGGSFTVRGVEVVWPKRLEKLLLEPGEHADASAVHRALARQFPSA